MSTSATVKPRQLRSLVLLLILLPFVPVIVNFRFMAETIRTERESVRERFTLLYTNHLDAAAGLFEKQLLAETESFPTDVREMQQAIPDHRFDAVIIVAHNAVIQRLGNRDLAERLSLEALLPLQENQWNPTSIPGYYVWRSEKDGNSRFFLKRTVVLGRDTMLFFQNIFGAEPPVSILSPDNRKFPIELPSGEALISKTLTRGLPDWKISLFAKPDAFWFATVSAQVATYKKIGLALVIGILLISSLAGYAVARQMRLSEMQLTSMTSVAHELKTPLSSMRLLLETMTSGRIKNEMQRIEYMELIQKENERLSRVVESFLTLLRMQNRDYKPPLRVSFPPEFIKPAVDAVRIRLEEMGFDFHTADDGSNPPIMADPIAIQTVLINLLENAIKYSEENKKITLTSKTEGGWFYLSVQDSGVGLLKSEMHSIFRPFYQADSKLSRRREGAGLGLSIVDRIIRAHKGKIEVISEPNKGSTFTIQLPIVTG